MAEEITIDFREWAKTAKALMEWDSGEPFKPAYKVPGCRLIRKVETNYGSEMGLAIRIDGGETFRMASREWTTETPGQEKRPLEWWEAELVALFADALCANQILKRSYTDSLQCITRRLRLRDGDGGAETLEEVMCYVPGDRYARAYLKAAAEDALRNQPGVAAVVTLDRKEKPNE